MIEPFLSQNYDFIIPLIDARRMEVYCAVFDGNSGEIISETEAKILDENSFQEFAAKKVLFVGDGANKAKEIYHSQMPNSMKTFILQQII